MSSKYLARAWDYPCVTCEEKLVLLALAECADQSGAVLSTLSELRAMTSMSDSLLDNVIGKLSVNGALKGLNKRTALQEGHVKCKLHLTQDNMLRVEQYATINPQGNQPVAQNLKTVSRFNQSQIAPLNRQPSKTKTINLRELSPAAIEDWAETVMFKMGYGGQTPVWASYIENLHNAQLAPLQDLDELLRRLHSHLVNEKSNTGSSRGGRGNNTNYQKAVKLSPAEEFRRKMARFRADDE